MNAQLLPVGSSDNDPGTVPEEVVIKEAFDELEKLKEKRRGVNEQVSSVVSELGSVGIPPKAVRLISALAKLTEEERAEIEAAVVRCREALGWDAQQSLL